MNADNVKNKSQGLGKEISIKMASCSFGFSRDI